MTPAESKDMHGRLTDDFELSIGVNVRMIGCLSLCVSVQCALRLTQQDRLQSPHNPDWRKIMAEWLEVQATVYMMD